MFLKSRLARKAGFLWDLKKEATIIDKNYENRILRTYRKINSVERAVHLFCSVIHFDRREEKMLAVAALGAEKKLTTLKIIDKNFDAKNAAPGKIFSKLNLDPDSRLIFAQNKFDLPEPLLAEIRFAKNLKEAAELMGIRFIDYLSIAEYDNYLSFKESKYIKF